MWPHAPGGIVGSGGAAAEGPVGLRESDTITRRRETMSGRSRTERDHLPYFEAEAEHEFEGGGVNDALFRAFDLDARLLMPLLAHGPAQHGRPR